MLPNQPYLPWLFAALVALLLVWLAWRRPNRQRLVWRVLASVVAGISLVLLLFPPTFQRAITPTTAILLTDGFNRDTLEALLEQAEAKPEVFSYQVQAKEATPIPDLYTLRQEQPALQTLHVLGYGLEQQELQALNQVQLIPHLSKTPAGVLAVNWPENILLGEAVEVTGRYRNESGAATWLYLQAAGRAQDSIEVATDSTYTFRLRYTPKQAGRYTYSLLTRAGAQTDTLGQVPVQVKPVQELGVLLLASAPSFEFKFLKNHLAELQHRVALRTTISKDTRQSEWLNMPKTNLDRITPRLLQVFDVVITEPQALQGMSASERTALENAVREDGLGVLTVATAPVNSRSTAFFTNFQTRRLTQQDTRNTRASWAAGTTATANAAPYTLVNATTLTGLVEENGNSLLAGAKRAGWGKVAISLVPQTFPWQLEGKQDIYASYWANLLSEIAREEVQEQFWHVEEPQVPQPDQPVTLAYTAYTAGNASAAPAASVTSLADSSNVNLPLAQNPVQPEQFRGTFWPRQSGWHQVQTTEDAPPYYFFVQTPGDWTSENIAARKQATQAFVAKQKLQPAGESVAYQEEQVPLIWFFALFVLSSGFLWLEEKL